jgi:glycosyltransferase involved in cell wall biosynthesis
MQRIALALQGLPHDRAVLKSARDSNGESAPRMYLFDDLFVRRYDESILQDAPPTLQSIYRTLPRWMQIALEVHRRRDEYDAVVSWNERVTLALMAVQRFSSDPKPHIPMMYWFSRPSVRTPMRVFGSTLASIITWSSVQRDYAVQKLGVPSGKIYLLKHFVDQLFWSPRESPVEDLICAAGAEMRDYLTLIKAMRGTNVRCHIATDHVRIDRLGFGRRVAVDDFSQLASPNVTLGLLSRPELRALYARSRFVVVPLRPSDTDNGITVILEAMAMGKPVICTKTRGQVDVIQDGVTGIFVPAGDPVALRNAILSLWHDPERVRAMGQAGRRYIEKHHTLDKFCYDVRNAIGAALSIRSACADGSLSQVY